MPGEERRTQMKVEGCLLEQGRESTRVLIHLHSFNMLATRRGASAPFIRGF